MVIRLLPTCERPQFGYVHGIIICCSESLLVIHYFFVQWRTYYLTSMTDPLAAISSPSLLSILATYT